MSIDEAAEAVQLAATYRQALQLVAGLEASGCPWAGIDLLGDERAAGDASAPEADDLQPIGLPLMLPRAAALDALSRVITWCRTRLRDLGVDISDLPAIAAANETGAS